MNNFKNALCSLHIPEYQYCGKSVRYSSCQRKASHIGKHKSWSREWNTGDRESTPRVVKKAEAE